VVEQALGDPRRRGDVVDRDLVERPLAEDLDPEAHELLATGVGAPAGAAGGGHGRPSVPRAVTGDGGSASPSAQATSASHTATIASGAA
jgi:hypothetical protein